MGEHTASHTPLPWSVGFNGRSIIREVPGMCDGGDHYMVAVLSAHSLLLEAEAKANAALIVRTVNTSPAVADLVKALKSTLCELSCCAAQFKARPGGSVMTAIVMGRTALSRFRELEKGND